MDNGSATYVFEKFEKNILFVPSIATNIDSLQQILTVCNSVVGGPNILAENK